MICGLERQPSFRTALADAAGTLDPGGIVFDFTTLIDLFYRAGVRTLSGAFTDRSGLRRRGSAGLVG
jgi:hypothetical protein